MTDWKTRALIAEARIELAVAICEIEQLHKHSPDAPVDAWWITYALKPEPGEGGYYRPDDWDAVVGDLKRWRPEALEAADRCAKTDDAEASEQSPDSVRLSVNLAPDVAAVLTEWADRKQISATEAVRRAIAVWHFVETEIAAGNRLAVVEGSCIREVAVIE